MTPKKNILITGCTGGIGTAITKEFPSENLILVGKDPNKLKSLSEELPEITHVYFAEMDLCDELSIQRAYEDIIGKYEKIDWIIYSAGHISNQDSTELMNYDAIAKTFGVNLFGMMKLMNLFHSQFDKDGGVIAISSTAGISGNGRVPGYASSKGALNTFIKSVALSWSDTKKRAIAICPGPTNTAMRESIATDAAKHQSPQVVSSLVAKVIYEPIQFPNNSIVVVKDGKISRL